MFCIQHHWLLHRALVCSVSVSLCALILTCHQHHSSLFLLPAASKTRQHEDWRQGGYKSTSINGCYLKLVGSRYCRQPRLAWIEVFWCVVSKTKAFPILDQVGKFELSNINQQLLLKCIWAKHWTRPQQLEQTCSMVEIRAYCVCIVCFFGSRWQTCKHM